MAIVSVTACSVGVDISFVSTAVFVEMCPVLFTLQQAESRLHRTGQHCPTHIYHLLDVATMRTMQKYVRQEGELGAINGDSTMRPNLLTASRVVRTQKSNHSKRKRKRKRGPTKVTVKRANPWQLYAVPSRSKSRSNANVTINSATNKAAVTIQKHVRGMLARNFVEAIEQWTQTAGELEDKLYFGVSKLTGRIHVYADHSLPVETLRRLAHQDYVEMWRRRNLGKARPSWATTAGHLENRATSTSATDIMGPEATSSLCSFRLDDLKREDVKLQVKTLTHSLTLTFTLALSHSYSHSPAHNVASPTPVSGRGTAPGPIVCRWMGVLGQRQPTKAYARA